MKLKHFIRKLQQCFTILASRERSANNAEFDEDMNAAEMVPKDVKRGHIAVKAVKGGEKKRFIVELHYLTNPAFVRLLEQAREEYGFRQKGVLIVPCQPAELQNILDQRRNKYAGFEG